MRRACQTFIFALSFLCVFNAAALTDIFVSNPSAGTISAFNLADGSVDSSISITGLSNPQGITIGPDNHIYVADTGASRKGKLSAAERKEAQGLAEMASMLSILKLGAQVEAAK